MREGLLSSLRDSSRLGGSILRADARSYMLPPRARLKGRNFKTHASRFHVQTSNIEETFAPCKGLYRLNC